ncbi:MAG: SSS family solute:Na+ symporter [Roseivirga sp.]|jgi:SSS family solute:Na+ symporter
MLAVSITIYILLTLLIGYWASRKIKTSLDFTLAGRKLSFLFVGVTIFATWFGPELVMGMPALFAKNGVQGIITDQFGTLLCLVLVARFYTKKMYRMNIVTINDFFRNRFSPGIETFTSIVNLVVYTSWIAAQFLALALIFNSLFGITIFWGVIIGAVIVVIYTYLGGMWAVSYTDLIQSIFIILGLALLLYDMLGKSVPLKDMIAEKPKDFLDFLPKPNLLSWIDYMAMWLTFGIGVIASQEIYQRALSAKSEKSAVRGVYLSGILLFVVGIIPILLGLIGGHLHPELLEINEGQNLIPEIVRLYSSEPMKILFFGALISAILSTSSGAMLAPATIIGENIIKPRMKNISDKQLLYYTRFAVILVAALASAMAMSSSNIHELVIISSVFIMICLFAPFTFGLFWKKASVFGAWMSLISGAVSFLICTYLKTTIEPFMIATSISVLSIVLFSYLKPDNSWEVFSKG